MMYYVQCQMKKENYVDVSWIEEKFAVVGKQVKRKTEDEKWDEGWVITATYTKVNEEHIKKIKDLYRHHRKGTDI